MNTQTICKIDSPTDQNEIGTPTPTMNTQTICKIDSQISQKLQATSNMNTTWKETETAGMWVRNPKKVCVAEPCPICFETTEPNKQINCPNKHLACCVDCWDTMVSKDLTNSSCPLCRKSLWETIPKVVVLPALQVAKRYTKYLMKIGKFTSKQLMTEGFIANKVKEVTEFYNSVDGHAYYLEHVDDYEKERHKSHFYNVFYKCEYEYEEKVAKFAMSWGKRLGFNYVKPCGCWLIPHLFDDGCEQVC